jgi:hypothetical protein
VSFGVAVGDVRSTVGRQPWGAATSGGSAGPDERDAPTMTTIAFDRDTAQAEAVA